MGRVLRVFVVEDSAIIRKRIMDNLRSLGHFDVVGYAESENEAVEAILIQPDGKIIAAGFSDNNTTGQSFIALARYNP